MKLFSFVTATERKQLNLKERRKDRQEVFQHALDAYNAIIPRECFSENLQRRVQALSRKSLERPEIDGLRRQILKAIGRKVDEKNATKQLRKMMAMYDELFFDNTLEDGILAWKTCDKGRSFRVESKVERSAAEKGVAGITYIDDESAGVKIDIPTVLQTEFDRNPWVGRVPCNDVMACILLLVEHELCHLWCFLYRDAAMKYGVHSGVFKSIMKRLFKQLGIHHKLGAPPCEGDTCTFDTKL